MRKNLPASSIFSVLIYFMCSFYQLAQANKISMATSVSIDQTPPQAVPDVITTAQGVPVTITVWSNDIAGSIMIDPQMVKLIDPVTGQRVFSVTIANEGTFSVNYLNGQVTFTPVPGFSGISTVNYVDQDLNGEFSNQAAITVTVTTNPLPVSLTTFTVLKEGKVAILNWETTEETNSDYFDIQHSVSGKDWADVGQVISNGESKVLKNYSFNHANPINGQNLYRLKMVDRDNSFAYSRIQGVTFEGLASDLSIYPNPVADKMIIRDFSQVTNLVISDLNGRTVHQSGATATGEINVRNLSAGMYVVKIARSNGVASAQKILISK